MEQVRNERFRSRVRRNVRRAEHAGVEVEVDRSGRLVPAFYELYERSIARWAAQQHEPLPLARLRAHHANPERKFALVAETFREACTLWVARAHGEIVAALIVLRYGGQAKYWRGAMDRDAASPVRANELLHCRVIEDACANGCDTYAMGDASPGSSLAHFKEGFGAVGRPSPLYRRERLPLGAAEARARALTKKVIGFRDA
jgi:lipid II:glycine glycyltransferase (peptidoglycan interpeptide bridge formation enzyme)